MGKPVLFFKKTCTVLVICALLAWMVPESDEAFTKEPNATHKVLSNCVLLSLTALITISLTFEYIQHNLHHHTRDVFMPVLHALNSELMGIGFLAIIFYLLEVRFDVLTQWGTSTICDVCDPCMDFPKVQHAGAESTYITPWDSAENPYHKDFNPATNVTQQTQLWTTNMTGLNLTAGSGQYFHFAPANARRLEVEEARFEWAAAGPNKQYFKGNSRIMEAFGNMYSWAVDEDIQAAKEAKLDRHRRKLGGKVILGVGCNFRLCQDAYNQTFRDHKDNQHPDPFAKDRFFSHHIEFNGTSQNWDWNGQESRDNHMTVDLHESPTHYEYAGGDTARPTDCDGFHSSARRYLFEFEEANPGYLTEEHKLPSKHSSFDAVYDAINRLPVIERHEVLHGQDEFEHHRRLAGGMTGECYHCDSHLLHLFEDVHMTLFLVMVLYFARSSFLIYQADKQGKRWIQLENMMKTTLNAEKVVIQKYYQAYSKGGTMAKWVASEELEYMLLRKRFLQTGKSSGALDPPDFNFAFYLSIVYGENASHVVHIPPRAWMLMELVFIVFWAVMQAPPQHRIRAFLLCMLALAAGCIQILKKMGQIKEKLICKIPGPSKSSCNTYKDDTKVDELLEMLADNDPRTVPAYLKNRPSKRGNQQEMCFWFGREGPEFIAHATRLMMINMLIFFILCLFAIPYSQDNDHNFTPIICVFLPIFIILNLVAPPEIIKSLSVTSSVELMKNPKAIKSTERHVKLSRSMRTIKMLRSLQMVVKQKKFAQAASAGGVKDAPKVEPQPARPLTDEEKVQQRNMKEVFDLFDASGDGQVDVNELSGLMGSLGVHLEDEEKELLMKEFDTGGDGSINFDEFWQYMSSRNAKEDPHQVVEDVFEMIDKDGSKSLTTEEFSQVLLGLPALNISENDVNQLVREIDSGGDGEISIHEFAAVLEKYQ
jgi:Ca2+-binding EF-hand superfamily protein